MNCSYCSRKHDCTKRGICSDCEDAMVGGVRSKLMDCPGCSKDMAKSGFLYFERKAYCYDCIRKMNLEICMGCLGLFGAGDFVDAGGVMICRDCAASRGLNNCAVCNEFTNMCEHDGSVCDDCHINSVRFAEQRK